MKKEMFSVAEIFCGCGGFSYGFEMQGEFQTVLGIDIKTKALNTFQQNHKNPCVFQRDVRLIENQEILDSLKSKGIDPYDLDVLIGGPPCQGFSQMRRSENRDNLDISKFSGYSKLAEDKRNDLVLRFLEIAELLMPKCIVIENVKQVKNHVLNGREGGFILSIEEALEELGYNVKHNILNAADFGVPQLRERVIIIASRIGVVSFPEASHSNNWVTVGDAISDLPSPAMNKDTLKDNEINLYKKPCDNYFLKEMRKYNNKFPANHNTRKYKDDIIKLISEMPQGKNWTEVALEKRQEYEMIISNHPNKDRSLAIEDLVEKNIINKVFYKDYYWSAYTRLSPTKPALTITANANFLGSGRYTHPTENRGITPREAARLQSFPDNFTFYSSDSDDSCTEKQGIVMDMIGEAVPPLLAMSIAKHIVKEKLI